MEIEGPIYEKNNFSNNLEERSAEQRAIDDWLPVASSRTAKWWFSSVHNVTAIVGAGVLGLPYAMSELGWGAGVTAMANMLIVIHLIGDYQLYAMPIYDMIETVLVRKLKFKPSWYLRFITRNTYVGTQTAFFLMLPLPFFFQKVLHEVYT